MCRDANPTNNQTEGNLLGDKQEAYLTKALLTSKATWKILALDGPVSIVVGGEGDWDAWAQVQSFTSTFIIHFNLLQYRDQSSLNICSPVSIDMGGEGDRHAWAQVASL